MPTSKSPAQRMCCVCKVMKDKAQLIRIAKLKDGEIFVDSTYKAGGRGAFVCNDPDCLAKCIKQRSLNRAFRCDVPASVYAALHK